MVYLTLLAAIGDVALPAWRPSTLAVYGHWKDLGCTIDVVLAGIRADVLGFAGAMWLGGDHLRIRPRHGQSYERNAVAG
jgi:hypothetical protein